MARDGRQQVVGSQEDSIDGLSQRSERSDRRGMRRAEVREGVPRGRDSIGKGMVRTAAFPMHPDHSLTLPFDKH